MSARLRLGLLVTVATALALLVAFGPDEQVMVDRATQALARTAQAAPSMVGSPPAASAEPEAGLVGDFKRVLRSRRASTEGDPAVDLFMAKSWYVPPPPPPPPKPVPPPPPSAPPLPYAFMGQYLESDGRQVIFLVKGDRLYTTTSGEVIDGMYRVEGIQHGQLGLTYLPLNIKQSLSVGEAS